MNAQAIDLIILGGGTGRLLAHPTGARPAASRDRTPGGYTLQGRPRRSNVRHGATNRPVVEIPLTFRVAGIAVDQGIAVETGDIVFATDRYELRYVIEIK